MEDTEKKLGWFKKLQKNSWNPEVIISGLTLAFILAFPKSLYEFAAKMVQDWGVSYLGGILTLMYSSFLINVFKIFLIVHLSLRFIWTGLLGVSYAFPNGVDQEKLPKHLKGIAFGDVEKLTMRLERICSMAFGIPVYLAFIFVPITLYLIFLIFIYKLFDLSFFTVYILFLISIIGFVVYGYFYKKFKKNNQRKANIMSTLGAVYLSNIGNLKFSIYQFIIMLITVPFIINDTKDFSLFFHEISLNDDQLVWSGKEWYYEDARPSESRFGRILLPSEEVIGNYLKIQLAYYDEDKGYVNILNDKYQEIIDSLQWEKIKEPFDLYKLSIDNVELSNLKWTKVIRQDSNQKAYQCYIDISNLREGSHELIVDKLLIRTTFTKDGDPKLRKQWASVHFFKYQ
ncbi:MAG: hypothetical protein ACK4UK_04360 [Flavobacterium sp.]